MRHYSNAMRSSLILAFVLLGAALACPASLHAQEPAVDTVRLVIDYGDGVERHFTRIGWRSEMTALAALQAAARHPRGITFESRGSGATTFITEIDEVENEGGRGRNWLLEVNGELSEVGAGSREIQRGDTVTWRFGKYRP